MPDNIPKFHWIPISIVGATAVFSSNRFFITLRVKITFHPLCREGGVQDWTQWVQIHVLACPDPPQVKSKISGRNALSPLVEGVRPGHLIYQNLKYLYPCVIFYPVNPL